MADILDRLKTWQRGPGPLTPSELSVLYDDLHAAVGEIMRLRAVAGAVSDLPAEDEQRLNKVYGGEGGYRGR